MGISINSNIASLTAQRRLAESSTSLSKTFQRLASGQRINQASDDPAGLAISESLRKDTRVYSQAIRNVNDGLSALNIAQGALEQLSVIAIRQKELAEQAANGTYSATQRKALDAEANALVEEFNRITQSTKFNGISLTEDTGTDLRIQAGYGVDGSVAFALGDGLSRLVGSGAYQASMSFNTGSTPRALTSGDVNGDGLADLVSADYSSGTASVLLGNGDGTFKARISFSTGSGPSAVELADLNGDGKLDLMVADRYSSSVSILMGNGNGTFAARRTYAIQSGSTMLTHGDINNDGVKDIVTSNYGSQSISVILGNSDGSFSASRSFASPLDLYGIALGDLNGDGNLDAIAGGHQGSANIIYIGNGNGTFKAGVSIASEANPAEISIADANRDGILDFISADTGPGAISLYIGNGDGTFKARQTYSTGTDTVQARFIDMNGDGLLDLFGLDGATSSFSVFIGNGNGTFKARTSYATGGNARYTSFADMNGDGVADVTNTSHSTSKVFVHLSRPASVTTEAYLDIKTVQGARQALDTIDQTLNRISKELGAIGSMQSRLSSTLNTLITARENFSAAAGRIADVDVAMESAKLVKEQVLQQAVSAILGQANQQPALALQLLN